MNENIDRDKPLKVELVGDGYDNGHLVYDFGECPNCGRAIEIDYEEHYKYCPTCGQRLDWSYVDDD